MHHVKCLTCVRFCHAARPLLKAPVSWSQMTRGTVDVAKASWKWIANGEHSTASRLAKRMPVLFDDEAKFGASHRQGLLHLLQHDEDATKERWLVKDQEVYETTVVT